MSIQNKLDELIKRHDKLREYHDSLIKTYNRVSKIESRSFCGLYRTRKLKNRIMEKSRLNLAEATAIYHEWKRIAKGEQDG